MQSSRTCSGAGSVAAVAVTAAGVEWSLSHLLFHAPVLGSGPSTCPGGGGGATNASCAT